MATPEIRVKLTPEGLADVVDALRRAQAEAEAVSRRQRAAETEYARMARERERNLAARADTARKVWASIDADDARRAAQQADAAKSAAKAVADFNPLAAAAARLNGVLGALGFTVTIAGFVALGKSALDSAAAVENFSQVTGSTIENASAILSTASKANVSQDQVQAGLSRLIKNVGEFRRGVGEAADTFEELGLTADQFAGKDTAEIFSLIAQKIAAVPDEAERARLAIELFGTRSGAALVPLLNDLGREGIDAVRERLRGLGTLTTTELGKTAEEINRSFDTLNKQSKAKALQFMAGFAPALSAVLDDFKKNVDGKGVDPMREFGETSGRVLTAIAALFRTLASIVAGTFNQVGRNIAAFVRVGELLTKGRFSEAADVVKERIADNIRDLREGITDFFEDAEKAAKRISGQEVVVKVKPKVEGAKPQPGQGAAETDDAGATVTERAQKAIAEAVRKSGQEQIAVLQDVQRQRREVQERAAQSEQQALAARLASTANLLASQQALEKAEIDSIARRSAAAKTAFTDDNVFAEARYEASRARILRVVSDEKTQAAALAQLARQSNAERTAVARAYFDSLSALQLEYVNRHRASQQQVLAIDKQIADNRKSSAEILRGIEEAGFTQDQKIGSARLRALEAYEQLQAAVLTGNADKQREFLADVQRAAQELAGLGQTALARQFVADSQSLAETGLEAQKRAAQATAAAAAQGAAGLQKQLDGLKAQFDEFNRTLVADVKVSANQDQLLLMKQEIQKELDRQPFTISVRPNMQGFGVGGPVQSLASGGRVRGVSPHPRADNIPALLTAGEFVQPVRAVQHYGTHFMEAIRRMELPKYADGGAVGVAAMAAGGELMTHDIRINGRQAARVMGEREQVQALVDALKIVGQGT